jgi:DNA repair protein RadA/Sms
VAQTAARLKEAQKLGFTRAIAPEAARGEGAEGIALNSVSGLASLVADIAERGSKARRTGT